MRLQLPPPLPRQALPTLNLLLALAAGLSLAYWGWLIWQSTRTPVIAPAEVTVAAKRTVTAGPAIAAHLFVPVANRSSEAVSVQGEFKLTGTFTGEKNLPGYAIIIGADGKPGSFTTGSEVAPGIVLQEIAPEYVLLRRNGTSEKLELPRKIVTNLIVPVR